MSADIDKFNEMQILRGDHDPAFQSEWARIFKEVRALDLPAGKRADIAIYKLWQSTRTAIPEFGAELKKTSAWLAAEDLIGQAHIICNQAGIPPGEIIGRLVALSGKGDATGWISVERQLPGQQGQDSEEVLCFLSGHCAPTDMECRQGAGWGIRLGWYDAGKGMFRTHGKLDASVTHWMPLPATPQTAPSQAKSEGDAK